MTPRTHMCSTQGTAWLLQVYCSIKAFAVGHWSGMAPCLSGSAMEVDEAEDTGSWQINWHCLPCRTWRTRWHSSPRGACRQGGMGTCTPLPCSMRGARCPPQTCWTAACASSLHLARHSNRLHVAAFAKALWQEVENRWLQVTSSAKRRRRPGSNALAQTPDGSFRDLMANARDLLLNHCGFTSVPEVGGISYMRGRIADRMHASALVQQKDSRPYRQDACAVLLRCLLPAYKWVSGKQSSALQVGEVQDYLERGPGFIFLYHPALGPLWDVICQKVCCAAHAEAAACVCKT